MFSRMEFSRRGAVLCAAVFALLLIVTGASAEAEEVNLVAWGDSGMGQCDVPDLPEGVTYIQVAGGAQHSLALRSDGTVVAWGYNGYGQCDVPALPSGVTYTQVACGAHHSLALRSDGAVVAWGWNLDGQCAVRALPSRVRYTGVAGGSGHSLAARSDGAVVAWGRNLNGQCDVPTLPAGLTYTQVAAGVAYSLALRSDGTAVAWGSNFEGECDVPALPSGIKYTQIAGGVYHSMALRSDGIAVAWGLNNYGQCDVPDLPEGVSYTGVACDSMYSLTLRSDGEAVAWGWNLVGQCDVPDLPSGVMYTQIACGQNHGLAVRYPRPALSGWGTATTDGVIDPDEWAEAETLEVELFGDPATLYVMNDRENLYIALVVNLAGEVNRAAFVFDDDHDGVLEAGEDALEVLEAGHGASAYDGVNDPEAKGSWGLPYIPRDGGLGGTNDIEAGFFSGWGSSEGSHTVYEVSHPLQSGDPYDFALSAGDTVGFRVGILMGPPDMMDTDWIPAGGVIGDIVIAEAPVYDVNLVAWGFNDEGQCDVPDLPDGVTYTRAAGGHEHSLALRSDGTVIAWGDNHYGQRNVPDLPPYVTYTDVAAGDIHSLALRSDGTAVGWGYNHHGQCTVPSPPSGVSYVQIAGGLDHTLALRSDGVIVALGSNLQDQCDVPPVSPDVTYTQVAAARYHSLALRSDGIVVAWGFNDEGQCDVPALPPDVTYTGIACSSRHSLALLSDGTAVAWGSNATHQCNVPALPEGVTYTQVAASALVSLAVRSDGTAVAWGPSYDGLSDVPALPEDAAYIDVAGGGRHTLAVWGKPLVLSGYGTATIDGVIDPDEWANAGVATFLSSMWHDADPDSPTALYVMNDDENIYLALEGPNPIHVFSPTFCFDSDHDVVLEAGEDALCEGYDGFYDPAAGSSWGAPLVPRDDDHGGTNDIQEARLESGYRIVYEVSHPLRSGDFLDFDLSRGDTVGLYLWLVMGVVDEMGTTRFPAPGEYVDIVIADAPVPAGYFVAADPVETGGDPRHVATGEFGDLEEGEIPDGIDDLAYLDDLYHTLGYLIGDGAGGFPDGYTRPVDGPRAIATGHLDEDRIADVVVVRYAGITVRSSMSAPWDQAIGNNPSCVAVGDVNGDGLADLVVGRPGTDVSPRQVVSVYLNDPASPGGNFLDLINPAAVPPQNAWSIGVGRPVSVAIGDFDGDGMGDIAVAQNAGWISVLLNEAEPGSGTASFLSYVQTNVGAYPEDVEIADLNGDGARDIAVAVGSGDGLTEDRLVLLVGAGDGTFPTSRNLRAGYQARQLAIGDLLNDGGAADVAVVGRDTVTVFLNSSPTGSETACFYPVKIYGTPEGVGANPTSLAIGDLIRDGRKDLAVANPWEDRIAILENHAASKAPDDGDQIPYLLDTDWKQDSPYFGDGLVEGQILDYGGHTLLFTDYPERGIRIDAEGGSSPFLIHADETRFEIETLEEGASYEIHPHGSIEVVAVSGSITIRFVGVDASVVLPAGNTLILDAETLTVVAPETNPDTPVVLYNGQEIPVSPGQTVDLTAPPENRPPVADAGEDRTVEGNTELGAVVALDGSASHDPDDDEITFTWTGPFPEGGGVVHGVSPSVTLSMGTNAVTLVVNDGTVDSEPSVVEVTVEDTTAPTLTVSDRTLHCTGEPPDPWDYAPEVQDTVDPNPSLVAEGPAEWGLGENLVDWTATDFSGNSATVTQTITIVDEDAPIITAPEDRVFEATGPDGVTVTREMLGEPVVEEGCDPDPEVTTDPALPAVFPLDETPVVWTAADEAGNSSSDTQTVTVEDTTPPLIIDVSVDPATLWPPNHKMVLVTVSGAAIDIADPAPALEVVGVSCNQPWNGSGDGNTEPDYDLDTGDPLTLYLRAERSGSDGDRVYTLTVRATDANDNYVEDTITVTVPHDRGNDDKDKGKGKGAAAPAPAPMTPPPAPAGGQPQAADPTGTGGQPQAADPAGTGGSEPQAAVEGGSDEPEPEAAEEGGGKGGSPSGDSGGSAAPSAPAAAGDEAGGSLQQPGVGGSVQQAIDEDEKKKENPGEVPNGKADPEGPKK